MHLGALEGSLRPGRPPGTILKSIKVIWIDFVQNEKNPFFRDFGPETRFRGRLLPDLTSRDTILFADLSIDINQEV